MLYRCGPALSARAVAPRRRGPRPHTSIDIHCHVHTPAAEDLVKDLPGAGISPSMRWQNEASLEVNRKQAEAVREQLTSVERRLADMDALGVDIQAISPSPPQYYYGVPADLGRQTARLINENIAAIVAAHPDRFVGMGTVPLQDTRLAVAELDYMVGTLGLRGVEISSNVDGAELSEERFRPFFAKAEALGLLVFMHPIGFTEGRRLTDHYLINIIGQPLDSTVAVHHLIFGGVLDDHPRLKLCIAHGGGYVAAYSGRMDHAHGARSDTRRLIKRRPTSYLKKLYFDTVVFTPHQLEYLVRQWGSDHVLLGTDYPYDMAEPDPVGFVGKARLRDQENAAVLGGNAARLLKIRLPKPTAAAKRKTAVKRKATPTTAGRAKAGKRRTAAKRARR
jgi:aminocarboxymuconate-semialdehyde decarboxylase